jgi:pimeloyl-ACP methyl ester carboxylesterase
MRLQIDGRTVHAATGGRAVDPALPLVVLVHGAGLDSTAWALHSRWFAHHGHAVLAVDLPGHGRSAGPPLGEIGALADWIARLIELAGAPKATLIGHSMGALVALETASRHKDQVAALGLIGAAAAMPVHAELLAAARRNDHAAIDMVALWGCGARAGLGGSRAPGLWMPNEAMRLLERAAPGVLFADLAACSAYRDGLAAAARIACPTILVLGRQDAMTPARAGLALAAAIPGARTVVLEDSGHMLMAERPDEVLDALRPLVTLNETV